MGVGVRDAFPPPMCCVGSCIHSFAYGNAAARPCRPAGAHPSLKSPRIMRVFLVWKRRYADVRAGTQAPPLRFRLGGLRVGGWCRLSRLRVEWAISCGWIACVVLFVGKTVHMNQHYRCCTFVSPGLIEHSEIYPGESRGGEPMPSALYFLKSIFVWGNHLPRMVMMCDEKKYNPQGGSLIPYIITQGRLRCTCQPCAIESITPMG